MTKDEAITKLKEVCHTGDPGVDHIRADEILCKLLKTLGYEDVVDEWLKIKKWYA